MLIFPQQISDEAMLQQIAINDQVSPSDEDYKVLQQWLGHPRGGARDLSGAGSSNLFPHGRGGRAQSDLVMLAADSSRSEPFMRWATAGLQAIIKCVPWWRMSVNQDPLPCGDRGTC